MTSFQKIQTPQKNQNEFENHQSTVISTQPIRESKRHEIFSALSLKQLKEETVVNDNQPKEHLPFRDLFRYADKYDYLLMFVGTIAAIGTGVSQPLQILFFGNAINDFNTMNIMKSLQSRIDSIAIKFLWLALGVVFTGFLQVACWNIAATRQCQKLRHHYVNALLRQDIGWYDKNNPSELSTRLATNMLIIQEGIGRKLGDGMTFWGVTFGGLAISFTKGWELTLVMLAISPLLMITTYLMMKCISSAVKESTKSYAKAGGIAEEALRSLRVIQSLNGVNFVLSKYQAALKGTTRSGISKAWGYGLGMGSFFLCCFSTYSIGMYYGAYKVTKDRDRGCLDLNECYSGGTVEIIFVCMLMGSMGFAQAGPSIQAVFAARATALDVLKTIDRKPSIDTENKEGLKTPLEGKIEFENVTFSYPNRPDVLVCKGYNLTIKAHEKIALVGESGSGKSTVISLIQRFYDPNEGTVKIDGNLITAYNIPWLRSQISVVSQEPALFTSTIRDNIRYGKPDATDKEIEDAIQKANVHEFIMKLPDGLDTRVGELGNQLSGGQKQRIAIARAIIRDPNILILDEATSALDANSEAVVQASLDNIMSMKKRTTIIIAHRLSTVRNADTIAVHRKGKIVELGTHSDLMNLPNGYYRALNTVQQQDEQLKQLKRANSLDRKKLDNVTSSASVVIENKEAIGNTKDLQEIKKVIDLKDKSGDQEEGKQVKLRRLWQYVKEDKDILFLGLVASAVSGGVFPTWGVFGTKFTVLLFKQVPNQKIMDEASMWSWLFFALGVVYLFSCVTQSVCCNYVAERVTSRIRVLTLKSMLCQEIGWHDRKENTSGALVNRLAKDTLLMRAMSSDLLDRCIMTFFSVVLAFAISFAYSWEMALLYVGVFPLLALATYVQTLVTTGDANAKVSNTGDMTSGSLMSEALGLIRTVVSLGLESSIQKKYDNIVYQSRSIDIKRGISTGFVYGLSQSLTYAALGFIFWFGSKMITKNRISFQDMFMVMTSLFMSTFGLAIAMSTLGDVRKAKKAMQSTFAIVDRKSEIDPLSTAGEEMQEVTGDIVFDSVFFAYPTRPDISIYEDYSMDVKSGQMVAIVGSSGSGKSTALALLERFYNPLSGDIKLDLKHIRQLHIRWLRDTLTIVSQEPPLFLGTIAENISYGTSHSEEEIINAAKLACAHDFIMQLPENYHTNVGDRGAQISGGQKQRIALARAIIRQPKILLLDEATSALDTTTEAAVMKSLRKVMTESGRTVIVVAHRLTSIKDADVILVAGGGKIVERGVHNELVKIPNGIYAQLIAKQLSEESHSELPMKQ